MAEIANIVEETVASETDKRAQLGKAYLLRKIKYGTNWNKLRIGLRWSTCRTTAFTSPSKFFFGLCSGTTVPPGDPSCPHAFGVSNKAGGWTSQASAALRTPGTEIHLITNGSDVTTSPGNNNVLQFLFNTIGRSGVCLDITKGSPNWTIRLYGYSYVAPSASHSMTVDQFKTIMQLADPHNQVGTGFYFQWNGVNIAVDESTYGSLDSFAFVWPESDVANAFEISDYDVYRLS